MATKEKMRDIFELLLAAFPEYKAKKETLALYQRKLADIPDHVLEQAVDAYIDSGKWFPKIAELREESRRVANLPTRFSSFATAEKDEPQPDLLAEWIALEDSLTYDTAAYLALADKFEQSDRPHRAEGIRERVNGKDTEDPDERKKYVTGEFAEYINH